MDFCIFLAILLQAKALNFYDSCELFSVSMMNLNDFFRPVSHVEPRLSHQIKRLEDIKEVFYRRISSHDCISRGTPKGEDIVNMLDADSMLIVCAKSVNETKEAEGENVINGAMLRMIELW
jgi:hypothetical protein